MHGIRTIRAHVQHWQSDPSDVLTPCIIDLGRHIVPGIVGGIARSNVVQLKQVTLRALYQQVRVPRFCADCDLRCALRTSRFPGRTLRAMRQPTEVYAACDCMHALTVGRTRAAH